MAAGVDAGLIVMHELVSSFISPSRPPFITKRQCSEDVAMGQSMCHISPAPALAS